MKPVEYLYLSATDRNKVLSLTAALDLLNEVSADLRIVSPIHEAKKLIELAIERIIENARREA